MLFCKTRTGIRPAISLCMCFYLSCSSQTKHRSQIINERCRYWCLDILWNQLPFSPAGPCYKHVHTSHS